MSEDPAKARIRQEWIEGSTSRIREGLSLLSHNPVSVDWHVFEGPTRPDVFIETDRYIIVVEGKRAEHSNTTSTKWMQCRHQMLRHIDCAWEIRGQKDVFGFFIVESADGSKVPEQWNSFAKSTTSEASVKLSLPHRGFEESLHISRAFIGVTTWQTVCDEFRDMGLHRSM